MKTPASHSTTKFNLPSIPALMAEDKSAPRIVDVEAGLNEWFDLTESNLLVVMGGFGAGKTTSLQRVTSKWDSPIQYIYFDQVVSLNEGVATNAIEQMKIPERSIVILDNFDPVNSLAGFQVTPPDLRVVSNIPGEHRFILATRRTPDDLGDELLRQLSNDVRLSTLGFRSPAILQLNPWELVRLKEHASSSDDEALTAVVSYLQKLPPEETLYLRRPLLVTMLLGLGNQLFSFDRPSVARIYHAYCDIALSVDYDQKRSRIPTALKRVILSELAYDIFSGTRSGARSDHVQDATAALALVLDRVSERVLEATIQDPSTRGSSKSKEWAWTDDFLTTNHLFGEILLSTLAEFSDKQYGFFHQSFYEYFVSRAIMKRILGGHALGLELDRLSMATIDSLAFAFVKELGGSDLRKAIKSLVGRPRLSVADRLVLLYLLEDELDFENILNASPAEYLDELAATQGITNSFFLSKMMRYQLVIAGKYSAKDYVDEVESHEDDQGLQAELRLHSAETVVTAQLIQRLKNPALSRARYITIYRLGQLGDETAIESLEMVAAFDADLRSVAMEAIERIRRRGARQ